MRHEADLEKKIRVLPLSIKRLFSAGVESSLPEIG